MKQKGRKHMPYCPKCDMEFVEGITVCTDCGRPLVGSKEAAKAMAEEAARQQEELFRRRYEEMFQTENEGETSGGNDDQSVQAASKRTPSKAYVNKEQRYEDMSSSASAFFFVGGVLAVAAVLCFAGIIPLPMIGFQKIIFQGMLAVLAVVSLIVAFSSKKSAGTLQAEAAEEQKETEEILSWFTTTYSGKELDDQLLSEDPDLSGEELALKRFELVQDYLITGRDLPDQSYIDALCDMIYSKLYENE